ncbi:PREDICTED: SAP30-binding protein isoform X2 [Tarenaya hassleriana]|uniref:SAP30-binding protein isoform X2 n=1 Tax=Tarenaya hassleriana TaxID=28532 RepID=UPI00053C606C|nr:PREDICTED: SAP30-binding protein isoform X2 [Tarenaya hassleriana]
MAPKKKHSEGIALLSVYSDEDDEEMEDAEEEEEEEEVQKQREESERRDEDQLGEATDLEEDRGGEEDSRTSGVGDGGASSVHATPRSIDDNELSRPDSSSRMIVDSEIADGERVGDASGESTDTLLDKFLPPPPREKCSEELQRKIDKFLSLKKFGKSFNTEVRNRKDYRNPDFLLHAVRYQDIDQIGSCFSKDVFDPHGYDPSDFYDEIEADMKRERERKEQESKKNQKLDFVTSGAQLGTVFAGQKPIIPIPGLPALPTSGLSSVSTDTGSRDGRANKKSKWDKVDGDGKNHPLPGSAQELRSNPALLSAASAGSGYTAFMQQRKREAEERRSVERKLERRS